METFPVVIGQALPVVRSTLALVQSAQPVPRGDAITPMAEAWIVPLAGANAVTTRRRRD